MLLFQSVSELLFNIVKHAGILKAKLVLEQDDQCTRLTIIDNGNGFDVATVMNDLKTAHGLLVIQDRLRLMDCKMEVTSEPGKGTRVVIEAPKGAS
jgi:signal transduction histidine kinase